MTVGGTGSLGERRVIAGVPLTQGEEVSTEAFERIEARLEAGGR